VRYIDALLVDRNTNSPDVEVIQDRRETRICRIFRPDCISSVQEHAAGQIESLLRAGRDQNLLRFTYYPPRLANISGDFDRRATLTPQSHSSSPGSLRCLTGQNANGSSGL
jgi:hypothetical protein